MSPGATPALRPSVTYGSIFTARKRSLGQGNIFTPVCHSVHREAGCLVLGACHVRGGAWSGGGACSQGGVPGGDPHRTATVAGSTHPTGMRSC